MSNYNLEIGINLNKRKLALTIPDNTEISELKYICKTDNSDNYIAEENNQAYFHYVEDGEEVNEIFYKKNDTNINQIQLPENFGTIVEVDEEAVLYKYITRVSNEKVYVMGEDFSKKESLDIDGIKAEVEEQVRNYGIAEDSIIGFDGDTIPDGYEEVNGFAKRAKMLWGTSMSFTMEVGQHALVMISQNDCLMIWVAGLAENSYMSVVRIYGNEAQVTFNANGNIVTIAYQDNREFTGNAIIS